MFTTLPGKSRAGVRILELWKHQAGPATQPPAEKRHHLSKSVDCSAVICCVRFGVQRKCRYVALFYTTVVPVATTNERFTTCRRTAPVLEERTPRNKRNVRQAICTTGAQGTHRQRHPSLPPLKVRVYLSACSEQCENGGYVPGYRLCGRHINVPSNR